MFSIVKRIGRHFKNHPLAYRLLIAILLYSTFFTLLATSVQLYSDYYKDVRFIEERLIQTGKSYIQGLSLSVWNIDEELTDNLLHGILTLPDICYLEIRDDKQVILTKVGQARSSKVVSREFRLEYVSDQQEAVFIGTLKVMASLEGVYIRLRERLLLILGTQAIYTFLVAGFILFIFQFLVTRHLRTMANYTQGLDLNSLEKPLVLNRSRNFRKTPDELARVTSAINDMITSLKISAQEMLIKARMEGELIAAAKVQQSFTPEKSPQVKGYDLAAVLYPAREVSGDYYDFIPISDFFLAIVVADVSGKGVSAAMYANITRVLTRDKSELMIEPVELLCSLNSRLKTIFSGHTFLTMTYVLLDIQESTISYASAGHEPLVLVKGDGTGYILLKPPGPPFCEMCVREFDLRIRQEQYTMQPGDLLFIYTDGLTDVMNGQGELFGEQRLYDLLQEHRSLSAQELIETIYRTLQVFQGDTEQADDITIIALKKEPENH